MIIKNILNWAKIFEIRSGGRWIWGWGQYPQHVKTGNSLRRRNYGDAGTNKSIFAHSKKNIILGIKKYNCKVVPRFIVYWKESKYNFVKASLTKLKVVFQCRIFVDEKCSNFFNSYLMQRHFLRNLFSTFHMCCFSLSNVKFL